MFKVLSVCGSICASLLCSPLSASGTALGDTFEDFTTFLADDGNTPIMSLNDFDAARTSLARQFEDICGDSFCEGEYGTITPLALTCSVSTSTGQIGQCIWTFAGLEVATDPKTGHVTQSSKVFLCDLDVTGAPADLAAFLRAATTAEATSRDSGMIEAKVPGTTKSLMDVLRTCI